MEVAKRARSNPEFGPVLERLKVKYGHLSIVQKLYNKIRTLGNSRRFNNSFPSLSNGSETLAHHKTIFKLCNDEILFKEIFSDIISRVANKQVVTKKEILFRAHNNVQFAPLMLSLKSSHSNCNLDQKIYNKVRSIGNTMRNTEFDI